MTPPIVLVPGMLCDAALWHGVRDELGPGVVDAAITAADLGAMAEQVLAAVDGPFQLVGLSLGAIAGFEVLRRAPERVRSLCVISTNAGAPRPDQYESWREMADGEFGVVVRERVLPTMFAEPEPGGTHAEAFLAMAHRVGPEVFRRQLAAQATRPDQYEQLSRQRVRTLVVCGERDALCPPALHRRLADTMPAARLEVLPGAGHLLPWESAPALGSLLRAHLNDNTGQGGQSCPKS